MVAIRSLSIAPGDNILLKRGSRFSDSLILNQSGSPNLRITVQAYGNPHQANPVIDAGKNAFQLNAVLLNGTSHVTVQDLDITNPGDNKDPRRGVYVYAENSGEVRDITLQNLFIHDVRGWMPSTTDTGIGTGKYANASGAIVFEANGNNTASYFTDITVQDNVIQSVDRQGIYTWSNWCRRPAMASFWDSLCFQPWYASTGLLVQRNRLYDIGGDGIVVTGNENALIRNNTVIGFNKRSQSPNAGIWTANSDGSLFQYNVVSGGTTIQDGMAYDVDHSTSGTIFEYNVSHDNEGGFFLLCPYDKPTKNFTIRYNLSVNDRTRIVEICDGQLVNGKIYKNTIFIGDGISPFIVTEDTNASLDVLLTDNIMYKTGSGHAQWQLNDTIFSVNDNLFFGPIDAYDEATSSTTSAPGLAAAGLRDPKAYLLLSGSAALGSAVGVAGDAHKDFFSDVTAAHKNLGFYAGPATGRPVWVDNFNQNSSLASGWSSRGQVALVEDPAGDLGQSGYFQGNGK
ncbi:uncharacterized protein PFLUO_LOCUS3497 [Penicillium psychrofluorescens]|uniref:uncharacterized protein n=1 Tax=Penicillium psychrofluorescens TaxID=3158075 RepID=UPI003CCCF50E